MGQPSTQASNAIIYLTYGAFLYVLAFATCAAGFTPEIDRFTVYLVAM